MMAAYNKIIAEQAEATRHLEEVLKRDLRDIAILNKERRYKLNRCNPCCKRLQLSAWTWRMINCSSFAVNVNLRRYNKEKQGMGGAGGAGGGGETAGGALHRSNMGGASYLY
jgi:hypothetical protein